MYTHHLTKADERNQTEPKKKWEKITNPLFKTNIRAWEHGYYLLKRHWGDENLTSIQ